MLYILIGAVFGGILCYSFVTDFLQMRKDTRQFLQNGKNFEKNDHSLILRVLSVLGGLVGLFSVVVGYVIKDDLNIALGIALVFMFIGQYLSVIYRSCYWANESSIITCGKLIRFKSVKAIKIRRSLFVKSYNVTTFNGEDIIVSKKTAMLLEEKSGKAITK